jgi:hypothetical protein
MMDAEVRHLGVAGRRGRPHTGGMDSPTFLFLLLAIFPVVAWWTAGRSAAEIAADHGRAACERAGVQWLDQSVPLVRQRLARGPDGRLGWERQFRFEYSTGGEDRRAGLVTLHGSRLLGVLGPSPRPVGLESTI